MSLMSKIVFALPLLIILPASAQQTIPLTRASCTGNLGVTLDAHWSNSGMSCTWGAGDILSNPYSCYPINDNFPPNRCARYVQLFGRGTTCRQITTTTCAFTTLEMNAQCNQPTEAEFYTISVSSPCC